MTLASPRPPVAGLLGDRTRTALRRRGAEMLGLVLLAIAALLALLLASYTSDDPSPFNATGEAPQNHLGLVGAHLAGALIFAVGWASAALPLGFAVWGLRFVLHRGEERALTRILLLLIGILVLATFLSAHVPPPGWAARHGLGGAVGDSLLRTALTLAPIDPIAALNEAIVVLGLATLAMMALGLGMNGSEARRLLSLIRGGLAQLLRSGLGLIGLVWVALRRIFGAAASLPRRRRARAPASRAGEETAYPEHDPLAAPILSPHEAPASQRTEPPVRVMRPAPVLGAATRDPVEDPPETVATEPRDPRAPGGGERLMARIAAAMEARRQATRADPPAPEDLSADLSADKDAGWDAQQRRPGAAPPIAHDMPDAPPSPHAISAGPGLAAHRTDADLTAMAVDGVRVPRVPSAAGLRPDADPDDAGAPGDAAGLDTRPVVQHPAKSTIRPSRRARTEAQPDLPLEEPGEAYDAPPLSLLTNPAARPRPHVSDDALEENARLLEGVLEDYGIRGEITAVRPGPVVTLYELEPAPGLKAARVIALADDIARSMSALSARIATVPGRSVIGIELPNATRERVLLREILAAAAFGDSAHPLPLALGKDIGGEPVVANLARMPHLLIAGTTGSGKSVAINTMILSLLYRLSPADCRLIMIDPKMLELSVYDGIPHLLSPVVTDPKKAVVALKWVVGEMEERYRKMSKLGVRNIEGYNARVRDALSRGEAFSRVIQTGFDEATGEPIFEEETFDPQTMSYIVVIVDEMADLMMVAGKEIEA
ncbi:MAG: DNA translocase FtsK 4TM domain-containing protein, partial [Pseudomonadota bacterium]